MPETTVRCGGCGIAVQDEDEDPGNRLPCHACESISRQFDMSVCEGVVARDGLGVKAKHAGAKPYFESKSVPDHSRRLDKLVHREMIIDRENNRYFERVTDYESGEVIHECDEPLSDHFGHGSAKPKPD